MANPEVSFIIPVYNEVEVFSLLVERMDALASRMTETCEVILVDDGSTDGTALLMETLALEDPREVMKCLGRRTILRWHGMVWRLSKPRHGSDRKCIEKWMVSREIV